MKKLIAAVTAAAALALLAVPAAARAEEKFLGKVTKIDMAGKDAKVATDGSRAVHLAEVLKAVAHPLRLRIVAILVDGDANVTELAQRLAAPQPIVSQQLRILRAHGLVAAVRQDGFATYRLVERNLEGLVSCMERCGR